jgi:hypothetical protein
MPQARHLLICMQSESLDGDSRQRSGDGTAKGKRDENYAPGNAPLGLSYLALGV